MNIWTVILLLAVSFAVVLYVLIEVIGVKTNKILGPPLAVAIIVVLLAGLSYYLLGEKSINVVITSDEDVLYKAAIKFDDDVWEKEGAFLFSSKTRGIPVIDYRQQVKDYLAGNEVKLCNDYSSQAIGTGRYSQAVGVVTVCVNKKGIRWYL